MAQSLRRRRGVAQKAQIIAVGAEMLFELTPIEQTHIRILPFAKPFEHGRQNDATDLRRAADARSEDGHMAHG